MSRPLIAALCVAATLAGCQKAAAPPPAPIATNVAPANTAPAAQAAAPNDAADAKAFLQGLYDHYKTSQNNSFSPFGASETQVFDPDTVALLGADRKALKGELGEIDGDWLCDCQDFASLKATIAVQSATPTTATATSDFVDVGMPGQGARHDQFQLVKVNGAWRIHDIKSSDEGWLRATLTKEIKSLKASGNPVGSPDEAP
jgi:hypothetical protein